MKLSALPAPATREFTPPPPPDNPTLEDNLDNIPEPPLNFAWQLPPDNPTFEDIRDNILDPPPFKFA
jgi:hypothetical protein